MENLRIEYIPLDELTPYETNARKHEEADLRTIINSIDEFGMCDPIGIWGKNNVIVEGHGRRLALIELGYTEAPCIRLDHLSDEQRRAYALAHNKTAEMSAWDELLLSGELSEIVDIDMTDFGFSFDIEEESVEDDKYTTEVNIPQYEITGDTPTIADMYNMEKTDELIAEIEQSEVTDAEKAFLIEAAKRHIVFNYRNIAEYYAQASIEMQRLMERSALVIIDVNNAIADGYAKLKSDIDELMEENDA